MRRCTVCRRDGHTSRKHDDLSPEQLAELKADGLAYLGRGFKELEESSGSAAPDLLTQLAENAEDSEHPEAELSPRQAAMREVVGGTPPAQVEQPEAFPAADPGPPADGADCNCLGDGDWHPPGTGGCVLPSVARFGHPVDVAELQLPPEQWGRPIETVELPDDLDSSEVAEPDTPQVTYWCRDCNSMTVGEHIEGCAFAGEADPGMSLGPSSTELAWASDQPCPECFGDVGAHDVGELGPQYVPWRTVFGPAEPIQITMPGVYILDPDEYHADPVPGESLSNSDAKKLIESCPAQFRYDKDNRVREEKDAYDRGHVVHELVLGKGGGIVVLPAEFKDWRKGEAQRIKREARAAGKAPILAADFAASEEMAAAMLADPYAKALLTQPGQAEAAMFWLDGSGVVRRCMVDYLPTRKEPGETMIVVDVKTSDEVAPNEDMERKVMNLGYHRQAATIADGILSLQLATDVLVVFLFQSKKPPFLVVPVKLTPRALQIGRIENRAALKQFAQCLGTGEWPAYYDPAGDIPEVGLPGWYEKRFEGEV
jgi:hypothetical protein